jgi:hypothetical protein
MSKSSRAVRKSSGSDWFQTRRRRARHRQQEDQKNEVGSDEETDKTSDLGSS